MMINRAVYSEVFEILKYMDKTDVMKIPIEILTKIKNNKDENYISKIDKTNKSIFQKIIDAIISLFNNIFGNKYSVGKIKNNTIFAQQYILLSNVETNKLSFFESAVSSVVNPVQKVFVDLKKEYGR